ncbi:hypothetical protein SAMN05444369_11943 [Capnocytophaga haemolytica]|uniref:Uncharacterized protein n=1 Tax=Capnocytophaga haemolytica TaxID=45243 RepID=A0AAX2H087_9FLAO|nr:hypothetical protein SAMN05444369_11943 [Capnocytophaga haemolytica]SNV11591.1 Uncharacterised protein [Capnocytophaga haemolytica]
MTTEVMQGTKLSTRQLISFCNRLKIKPLKIGGFVDNFFNKKY